MKFFIWDFEGLDRFIWQLFSYVSSWIRSFRAALHLKRASVCRQEFPGWSAHSLKNRHSGGVSCHGDLIGPACRALVG